MSSPAVTRIAHVSDLHVLDVEGVPWHRFVNKRLTGAVSLMTARANAHPIALIEQLVSDVAEAAVDHVVVTGDISNLALESEFTRARQLLAPLGGPDRLSVIPGNHDIYTRGSARVRRFERFFGDLMWPGVNDPTDADRATYPWHKRVGDVHIVGLCSAEPRAPLIASGHVTSAQLDRLKSLSQEHGFADRYAIGLVHHNLHARGARKDAMHGLSNRDAVMAATREAGLDMLLHGHTHVAHRFERGELTIIGSGSSTWDSRHPDHVARYNIYHVSEGRLVRVETRIWDAAVGHFVETTSMERHPESA